MNTITSRTKRHTSKTSTHNKKTWLRYFQLSCFALSDWSKNWCRDDETSFPLSSGSLVLLGRQALSLNKTLIVLHFLDTCVKDHAVIKKKRVSCRLHSHFQCSKGKPEFKIEVSCCMRQELPVLLLLNHLSFWLHSNCKQEETLSRTRLQIYWDVFFPLSVCGTIDEVTQPKKVWSWELSILRYDHQEEWQICCSNAHLRCHSPWSFPTQSQFSPSLNATEVQTKSI